MLFNFLDIKIIYHLIIQNTFKMKNILLLITFLLSINLQCQELSNYFDYKKNENLNAQIVDNRKIDSTTIFEKVVIDGYNSKIPFYHYYKLQNNTSKYIILLHGLGDSKESWVYPSLPYFDWSKNLTSIKDSLLHLGYNIIIPDAKFHGERSYELNFRPAQNLPPIISKNEEDGMLFSTLMSSTVKDIRIIMDYISLTDKNQKISFAVVGYSMGGALAILLNAVDNRISNIVACVTPLNHPEKELVPFNWSPKITQMLSQVTPMNYATNQRSPILLLLGDKDFFYSANEVSLFYNNIGIDEKKVKFFKSGHILPDKYKIDVIDWITTYNNTEK